MRRVRSPATARLSPLLFLVVIGGALLAGTLRPATGSLQSETRLCLICGAVGGADFVANILAFIPFGMAVRGVLRSTRRAAIVVVVFTLLIELLQWRVVPGRDASLGDVVANALGGTVGALIAARWRHVLLPERGRALIIGWSAVSIAVLGATYWMLMPSPVIYRYWSYWAPQQRGHQSFRGSIRNVTLFGTPIPDLAKIEPSAMPAEYRSGEIDLQFDLGPPYPTDVAAEVFRLANPLSQRANVAVLDRDVAFQPPLNASRWRFWSPSVRFSGVLDDITKEASMHFRSGRGVVDLIVGQHGEEGTVRRGKLGPVDSWKFVLQDGAVPPILHPLLAVFWFLVVFAPLGLWSSTTGRLLPGIVGGATIAAVGFLIAPLVTGLPPASIRYWVGGLACGLFGWACGRLLGRPPGLHASLNPAPTRSEVTFWKA